MTTSDSCRPPAGVPAQQEGTPPCTLTPSTRRRRSEPTRAASTVAARSIPPARSGGSCRLRSALRFVAGERGAATAEYAVATMAAVGFAGLLVVILRGDEVRGILTDLVRNALTVG